MTKLWIRQGQSCSLAAHVPGGARICFYMLRTMFVLLLMAGAALAQQTQPGEPTKPSLPPETTGGTETTPPATPRPLGDESGWRTVQDKQGICQWDVPGGWAFDDHHENTIRYGANQAIAVLRHSAMGSDWDSYKQKSKAEFPPTQVFADSPDLLWFQYSRGDRANHYLVAAPAGATVCTARVDVNPGVQGDLSLVIPRLARSIRAAGSPGPTGPPPR